MSLVLALLLPLASIPALHDRDSDWTEDVLHVMEEIERLHPDPFFSTPREEFETAVERVVERIPELSDDQMVVELMRLVALLSRNGRDGHSYVWATTFRLLPIQLYAFDDGWFVVGARAPHADLVGARVVGLGATSLDDAQARIRPLLTKDNEWNEKTKLAFVLTSPELLRATGIVPASDDVVLRVEQGGQTREVRLRSVPAEGPPEHLLPPLGDLLWLRDRERSWWSSVLEEQRALYVQYNEVRSADAQGRTLQDFADELVRTCDERGLERLVIDLRSNAGGDNTTFAPLVSALGSSPRLNGPGHLFLLTGRETFSAGGNFVTVMDQDSAALLVGEPTGGAPNQYGDTSVVELSHHKEVRVEIATRYHAFAPAGDQRLTNEPDLRVLYRSSDYFAGRDPVLQRALEYRQP